MVNTIVPGEAEQHLEDAVKRFIEAGQPVALTGAGISVESGIPDFRSPGGLWSIMPAEEYATLDVFFRNPEKAWKLYRAVAESIEGAEPNPAHSALADLEKTGKLAGIVTQNVDGLHYAAGSRQVVEMHGDHQHLQCLSCRERIPVKTEHFSAKQFPRCRLCNDPLKPNVVLFGEDVRGMDEINGLLAECDLLLVIGTSAQVYPAAGLPAMVKQNGGLIYEFNLDSTALTRGETAGFSLFNISPFNIEVRTDLFFKGAASETLTLFANKVKTALN